MAFGDNTSTVKLAADVGSFVRDIKTAEGQVKAFDKGLGTLKTAALGMATAFISAAGIGGMGAMVRSSMALQDTLAKTADRLGITTKALAAFHLQANLSGVGADGFDTSIQKMSNNLQDAANGIGTAKDAVKALGLDIYDLASKSPQEAFLQIAEAMKGVGSATQKLSITTDIFGERGRDVVNMLAEGREGFDAAAEKVEFFGTALSRVDAAKIEAANDAMTLAKESADGLATRVGLRLSPMLAEMAENFARNSVELARFLGFRTEQEELNHLLEKRADVLADVAEQEKKLQTFAVTDKIKNLKGEADALRQQINVILDKQKAEAAAFIESDKTRIAEEAATKTRLENAAAEKQAAEAKKIAITAELQAMRDMDAERKEIAEGWLAYQTENAIAEQAVMDQRASGLVDYQDNLRQITAIMQDEAEKQIAIEQQKSQLIQAAAMDVFSNAAGLFRALGRENKKYAKIAFAIEKGLALARIAIDTQVASVAALKLDPTGTLSARIELMGAISAGLVVGTALIEAGQGDYGGGGASVGGASNVPLPGTSNLADATRNLPQQQSGSITINVNGVITDEIVQGLIVPAIQDAVENRDVILIRNESRNGQQLAA